jgi:hypothetical protein
MPGLEVVFDLKAGDDQAMQGLEVVFDLKPRDDQAMPVLTESGDINKSSDSKWDEENQILVLYHVKRSQSGFDV